MIKASQFIAKAEEIANEGPRYNSGGWGNDGTCDCIGLIIGSIRRNGGQWRGLHGSNYAARREMTTMAKITSNSDLQIGEVVYKAYEPGQGGWTLDKYPRYLKGGEYYNGDLRDYYHIGIVVSIYPLRIRHVTSPGGAKMDTSLGKWEYHGKLKKIDYENEGGAGGGGGGSSMANQATVVLPTGSKGSTVNLRKSPDGEIIARIPVGTVVDVMDDQGQWCKVTTQGFTGYMMSNFIEYPGGGEEISGDVVTEEEREKIDNALTDIENRIEIIRSILGRG